MMIIQICTVEQSTKTTLGQSNFNLDLLKNFQNISAKIIKATQGFSLRSTPENQKKDIDDLKQGLKQVNKEISKQLVDELNKKELTELQKTFIEQFITFERGSYRLPQALIHISRSILKLYYRTQGDEKELKNLDDQDQYFNSKTLGLNDQFKETSTNQNQESRNVWFLLHMVPSINSMFYNKDGSFNKKNVDLLNSNTDLSRTIRDLENLCFPALTNRAERLSDLISSFFDKDFEVKFCDFLISARNDTITDQNKLGKQVRACIPWLQNQETQERLSQEFTETKDKEQDTTNDQTMIKQAFEILNQYSKQQ